MSRSELDILTSWAANEGWNPGLHDADIFWNTDPMARSEIRERGWFKR